MKIIITSRVKKFPNSSKRSSSLEFVQLKYTSRYLRFGKYIWTKFRRNLASFESINNSRFPRPSNSCKIYHDCQKNWSQSRYSSKHAFAAMLNILQYTEMTLARQHRPQGPSDSLKGAWVIPINTESDDKVMRRTVIFFNKYLQAPFNGSYGRQ